MPRRPSVLPPLPARPYSSTHRDDPRNFFQPGVNAVGDIVVPDVPAGAYRVRFEVPDYVPVELAGVASPMPEPVRIILHRAPTFRFSPEDTVIRGEIRVLDPSTFARHEVVLIQDPEAGVPTHRVPVTERGDFVLYAPEKRESTVLTLSVDLDGTSLGVVTQLAVTVNRTTYAPPIVIP